MMAAPMTKLAYCEILVRGIKDKYGWAKLPEELLRVLPRAAAAMDGGEGSGNFNHAGRPGKVGGSAEGCLSESISEEDAQELLSSNWNETIKSALEDLPKAKNGRPYITNGNISVDVPLDFVGETKSEIFKKSKTKEEKIGALWAIKNMKILFSVAQKTEENPDAHARKGIKKILRFDVAFPLQIGDVVYAFNTRFTVREFEDGSKVLASDLLETNKGMDLRLYAMSTKK